MEFVLFKLQSNNEEICALTALSDKKKCYELINENNERANITTKKLVSFLDQVDADIQWVISDYAMEHFHKTPRGRTFYSLLVARYFLLITGYFLLVTRYFALVTHYFLLVTCYLLLVIHYFLLVTRYFALLTRSFLLVTRN